MFTLIILVNVAALERRRTGRSIPLALNTFTSLRVLSVLQEKLMFKIIHFSLHSSPIFLFLSILGEPTKHLQP